MSLNFRTPTQQERKLAVEVAEAFGLEYSKLTNLQLRTIYCMIKQKKYDHKVMLETVHNHKNHKTMFWVMSEYVRANIKGDKL